MVFGNKVTNVYLNASLHVALAVGCLTLITYMQNDILLSQGYVGLMFTGTLIVYNGLKYGKIWWYQIPISFQHRFTYRITILAIFFFLMAFLRMPIEIQKSLVTGFCLVILYPWVRKLGWLKLFWVSGTIMYFTVVVPLLSCKQPLNILVLEGFLRFVLLSALMIPFEIYDSVHDPPQLGTLPQRFGVSWTKRFGYFLVVVYWGLVCSNHGAQEVLTSGSIALLIMGAIYKTQPHQSKSFTAFWVEALPMVWAVMVYGFGR